MERGLRAVDPAVAGARQISEAEPDGDGTVVRATGAVPFEETEIGGGLVLMEAIIPSASSHPRLI
jgi:hypothetical protein